MITKKTILKASSLSLLAFSILIQVSAQELRPFTAVNSPYNEHHAVLAPFGGLFFSVGYHPENAGGQTDPGDIWMSEPSGTSNWSKPQRVKELSTSGNDIVVGFTDPVSILVYHDGQQMPKGIHAYSRLNNSWTYLRPLSIENFNNESNLFSGRLSADKQTLIMSIQTKDGFGNEDIFVSFKTAENSWTAPLNLGPTINSYAQEQTPYLSEDQRTLYFSSNANAGGRGKNIFYSHRVDNSWQNWTQPKELLTANSIGSESGYANIFTDENLAIFTTTSNSEGMGDFVLIAFEKQSWEDNQEAQQLARTITASASTELENEEQNLKVPETEIMTSDSTTQSQVKNKMQISDRIQDDKKNNAAITSTTPLVLTVEDKSSERDASTLVQKQEEKVTKVPLKEVQILDAKTSEPLSYRLTLSDDSAFIKEVENQEEMRQAFNAWDWKHIMVLAKGYMPLGFNIEEWQQIEEGKLKMETAVSGASLVLKNIQFDRGTSEFADTKTLQELDRLVLFMKENQDIKIRLEGHTDNIGDPALNKELSIRRASKIRTYLALKGIDYERIRTTGWGGTRPLADNSSEEGREINRRVELYIER